MVHAPRSAALMDQSKKSLKNGLQPQTVYKIPPNAFEVHPKKVVFNPPALLREEASLGDEREARPKHLVKEKKKRDASMVKHDTKRDRASGSRTTTPLR